MSANRIKENVTICKNKNFRVFFSLHKLIKIELLLWYKVLFNSTLDKSLKAYFHHESPPLWL